MKALVPMNMLEHSHNMSAIRHLFTEVIWIDQGTVVSKSHVGRSY